MLCHGLCLWSRKLNALDRKSSDDKDPSVIQKAEPKDFSELQVRMDGIAGEDIANWCRLHREDHVGLEMIDEEDTVPERRSSVDLQ